MHLSGDNLHSVLTGKWKSRSTRESSVRPGAIIQRAGGFANLPILLGGLPKPAWPDAAYGAFVGYDLKGDHEEAVDSGIFVPLNRHGFRQRPAFTKVADAFKKVYRVRAT